MALNFSVTPRPVPNGAEGEYKYYPTLQSTGKNVIDSLVEHINLHNSKFNEADIKGVISELLTCITEMLYEGEIVQLGDKFGSFRLSIKSGGMTQEEMAANDGYFNTNLITGINVVWTKGSDFRDLMKKNFNFTEVTTKKEQSTELASKRAARAGKTVDDDTSNTGPDSGSDPGGTLG